MSESLDCTNGLSACRKAGSLIQWTYFGSKMDSVIQRPTDLLDVTYFSDLHCLRVQICVVQ